jgi:hypothetical protein
MGARALDILNDHIGGGQAKLARFRRDWQGSGVRLSDSSVTFDKQDRALLHSLLLARGVLDAAQFGLDDPHFQQAVRDWAAAEWGGFWNRDDYTVRERLPRPVLPEAFSPELLREHRPARRPEPPRQPVEPFSYDRAREREAVNGGNSDG